METFIVVVALFATAMGTLTLLGCLAGKRAELFKIFEIQQQAEEHQKLLQQKTRKKTPSPTPSSDTSLHTA